jgi:putative DNA primase/helicase
VAGSGDDDDPYGEADLVPVKGGKRKAASAPEPEDEGPDEGDDVNRVLAFQPPNHMGDAQRLIVRFGKDLAYIENVGWFVWDGIAWNREAGRGLALRRAMDVARAIKDEARSLSDKPGRTSPKRIKDLYAHADSAGNMPGLNGMMSAAEPFLSQPLAAFDSHAFLMAAPNGTIELKSQCELRPSVREDFLSRRLAVKYREGAECPHFDKFIKRIVPNDGMRAYLQRILGYCLSGSTREQAFFIFYGGGLNGKSTLLNVVRHIMGEYAKVTPITTFLAKREGASGAEHSVDIARLPAVRLVTAVEPPEGARLDEGRIKDITGGETISARDLAKGIIEFRPCMKPVIACNAMPQIRGADHGIWRRIRVFPFMVQIPEDEIDRDLERKLIAEAEGILQWMLTGFEEWWAMGLAPPPEAKEALDIYRATQDLVGEFIDTRCVRTGDRPDPASGRPYEVAAKDLYSAFEKWGEDNGLFDKKNVMSQKAFSQKLTVKGVGFRKAHGVMVRIGLQLMASAVADPGSALADAGYPEQRS